MAHMRPKKAIVLAAGLGKRMRPITDHLPKPLIKIAGKPMIDHALDRLRDAGINDVIVNVHYLADQIAAHVIQRTDVRIQISDERSLLLETGGGAKKALPFFNNQPFLTMNSDCLWTESNCNNLKSMLVHWNEQTMDMLLLIVRRENTLGYDGQGDFNCDERGQLTRRSLPTADFVYAGAAILKPELLTDTPEGPFSLNLLFDRAIARGRLFGHNLVGTWLHVGTPEAIAPAEEKYHQVNG